MILTTLQKLWAIWVIYLLPPALTDCPRCKKSPNLVTLVLANIFKLLSSLFTKKKQSFCGPQWVKWRKKFHGCHHNSVDLSAPTILLPRVRVPGTPSTLLSFTTVFVLYLSCEKNENKQKEAAFDPFFKEKTISMQINLWGQNNLGTYLLRPTWVQSSVGKQSRFRKIQTEVTFWPLPVHSWGCYRPLLLKIVYFHLMH